MLGNLGAILKQDSLLNLMEQIRTLHHKVSLFHALEPIPTLYIQDIATQPWSFLAGVDFSIVIETGSGLGPSALLSSLKECIDAILERGQRGQLQGGKAVIPALTTHLARVIRRTWAAPETTTVHLGGVATLDLLDPSFPQQLLQHLITSDVARRLAAPAPAELDGTIK